MSRALGATTLSITIINGALSTVTLNIMNSRIRLIIIYAECRVFGYCYAECRYAECRYANSRGAVLPGQKQNIWKLLIFFFKFQSDLKRMKGDSNFVQANI
jgi:hypothetical protein